MPSALKLRVQRQAAQLKEDIPHRSRICHQQCSNKQRSSESSRT